MGVARLHEHMPPSCCAQGQEQKRSQRLFAGPRLVSRWRPEQGRGKQGELKAPHRQRQPARSRQTAKVARKETKRGQNLPPAANKHPAPHLSKTDGCSLGRLADHPTLPTALQQARGQGAPPTRTGPSRLLRLFLAEHLISAPNLHAPDVSPARSWALRPETALPAPVQEHPPHQLAPAHRARAPHHERSLKRHACQAECLPR